MAKPIAAVQPLSGQLDLLAASDAGGRVDPDALLVRGLGTPQLTATIFNYIVGSGIFALPALMVARLGAAALLPYLLCAFLMALVGLTYAEAGSRVDASGGAYAYVEAGLGSYAGLTTGLLVLLSDVSALAAVATLLAGSFMRLLGLGGTLWQPAILTVLLLALAGVNIRGLRLGARVIEVSTIAKLLPLLAFVAIGVFFVRPANLVWTSLPPVTSVSAAAGVLLFAFTGIEGALQPSGEVRQPSRTVPRAIFLGMGAVTLLYLAIQAVALGVLGPALAADNVAPLAGAAAAFAGNTGRTVLLVAATVSAFGWVTGSLLASPRALFAFARDGFLPRQLAAVHPRFRTPHVSVAVYAVVGLALALTGTFVHLAILSALASLLAYFLVALGVLGLRRRGVRAVGEPFRAPGGVLVPVGTCLLTAWVASQTVSRSEIVAGLVLLVVSAMMWGIRALRLRAELRRPVPVAGEP